MFRMLGLALAGLTALSVSAAAQQAQPERLRGTVESVSGDSFTLKASDGKSVALKFGADTKFAAVLPGRLSEIKPDDFIGTATKGPDSDMVALEVVIFPNAMRGAGEGHYPWDKLPDTTQAGTPQVASTMTNGTVESAAPANNAPMVASTMTNGTVATEASKVGGKQLTVTYKGGQNQILVPPDVPVVTLKPGDSSLVKPGAKVFIVAAPSGSGGAADAKFVLVGEEGVTPPM